MELSIRKICHLLSNIQQLNGSNETSDYEMWSSAGIGALARRPNNKNHDEISKSEEKTQIFGMHDEKDVTATDVKKRMKLKFSKAWLSFLTLTLPVDVYKQVLASLHVAVIPYLSNPVMLSDFLTRSYDNEGVISVMAPSSLYPNDTTRLALSVPPSGALIIIALVHNLLRRHASINFLVHQEEIDESAKESSEAKESGVDGTENSCAGKKQGVDLFIVEEGDPRKSNVMRSSLWEIDTLGNHYCPPISRFVLSLENDLTVRAKTTEVAVKDFSSGSYATIFGEEMRRRVKQVPLAFYKSSPRVLFSELDFPGWRFVSNDGEPVSINSDLATSTEPIHSSLKRQRVE
ncbi:OLC1v1036871C1 [Oldenlandia corymbosa var. corymbosa]|uniref:OLC1v1036871C1 n=1 Tax=Oldenlandia corymbosa var. corymbosa TaxID=529605 RepID=A0AAV1CWZ2_OLDCO|nr:OLC1v1036871C1 [Oldenlandia corymbosa var. corymbosa]